MDRKATHVIRHRRGYLTASIVVEAILTLFLLDIRATLGYPPCWVENSGQAGWRRGWA